MSTGVNLGFPSPVCIVDADNPRWFSELLGGSSLPERADAARLDEARSVVLAGAKAAIADGGSASSLAVLVPAAASDLQRSASTLGLLVAPRLAHALVEVTARGDVTSDASIRTIATRIDAAHVAGAKFVCVVRLADVMDAASAEHLAAAARNLQCAGVEPDAWVFDVPSDATARRVIADQAGGGGRTQVTTAFLGDGALADETYGDALRAWVSGGFDHAAAADAIGGAISSAVRRLTPTALPGA